jgi:hypothetical protein
LDGAEDGEHRDDEKEKRDIAMRRHMSETEMKRIANATEQAK